VPESSDRGEETLRRLGEVVRVLVDTGAIVITALGEVDRYDLETLRARAAPSAVLVATVGTFGDEQADLVTAFDASAEQAAAEICAALRGEATIPDYVI